MKMVNKLVIQLTDEEKATLWRADEILTDLIDLLITNKESEHYQEEVIMPECFWSLRHRVNQIDEEELIPRKEVIM